MASLHHTRWFSMQHTGFRGGRVLQCFLCSLSLVTVKDKGHSEALGRDGQVAAALTGQQSLTTWLRPYKL